ncbi:hypothetical protein QBC41DRAFT_19623 [Cercophora samala]|uniref:Fucose-specific lectin n=1 Tax=Cercophora samala TaxID=330535 RepID=A0AA39ZK78_9PEZI|nr:hypothetical protein QBC41DRAFT_19623 [Cercophora samala]
MKVEADNDTWSLKKKELLTEQPGLEVVPHELLQSQDHLAQARPPDTAKYTVSQPILTCDAKYKIEQGLGAGDAAPEPVSTDLPEVAGPPPVEEVSQPRHATRKRRRKRVIIGSVVLIVTTLGAVLGGVLGSRAAGQRVASGEEASTTFPASPGSSDKADLGYEAIVDRSCLAVTARRRRDGSTEGWLFYEDLDYKPRMLHWDTKQGGVLKAPASFTFEQTPPGYARTRIWGMAATTGLHGPDFNPSVNLFISYQHFTDDVDTVSSNQVVGFAFGSDGKQASKIETVGNELAAGSQDTSRVAAYWPWIVHGYQESNPFTRPPNNKWVVRLVEAHNQLKSNYTPGTDWTIRNVTIEAKLTTKMSIIPLSADFKKSSSPDYRTEPENGYVVLYHDANDRLSFSHRSLDTARWDGYYLPWLHNISLPTDEQQGKGSISAFAVARSAQEETPPEQTSTQTLLPTSPVASPETVTNIRPGPTGSVSSQMPEPGPEGYTTGWLAANGVNVGVAYISQNRQFALIFTVTAGTRRAYWRDVNTDQVNKEAPPDLFTEIACVTMASDAADADGEEMMLPSDQDEEGTIATCFYQSNSQLVKVRWNGEFDEGLKWEIERLPVPTRDSATAKARG